ncbi:MAG: nucleotidyltransferase family protein [Vicinamibacterales bacterium]
MKAYLLAGGYGTRLRSETTARPKCLVEIAGRPLLAWWFDLCARHGISDVLVNVSHHGDVVRAFLETAASPVRVTLVEEPAALGNAGTVLANARFVEGDDDFFVLYADNLTDVDLGRLLAFHRSHAGVLTVGAFRHPRPREAGIVDVRTDGLVLTFVEKPPAPTSDFASAGIYVARQALFPCIPRRPGIVDFGYDVLPRLVGRLYAHEVSGYLADVGTEDGLATARAAWARRDPPALPA